MKNPNTSVFTQATELRAKGATNREIQDALGLSHSQLELHFMRLDLAAGILKPAPKAALASETAGSAWIAAQREAGMSWGKIAIMMGLPESRVRKIFAASGLRSKGMRIGRGGRYVADDQRFYTGADRAKLGSELVTTVGISAQVPEDLTPEADVVRVLPTIAAKAKRAPRAKK